MATDALTQLQASVTKTATFSGAAVSLPGGTPRRGMFARVIYSAASNASGANAVTFSVDVSPDGGTTWYQKTVDNEDVVNLTTTAKSGEIFLPIETSDSTIRVTATFSGAGTSPTITYFADLVLGRP